MWIQYVLKRAWEVRGGVPKDEEADNYEEIYNSRRVAFNIENEGLRFSVNLSAF